MKGQFGPNGALYSGWETRRHNPLPYDWSVHLKPSISPLIIFIYYLQVHHTTGYIWDGIRIRYRHSKFQWFARYLILIYCNQNVFILR